MLTIFDVFSTASIIAGALIGCRLGAKTAGVAGGGIGLIAGITVGWIVGRLPFVASIWWLRRSLQRASVAELRSRIDREYFVSHLLIAELVSRGEQVESLRSAVQQQLSSESADVQRFGQANARMWFPDLVEK